MMSVCCVPVGAADESEEQKKEVQLEVAQEENSAIPDEEAAAAIEETEEAAKTEETEKAAEPEKMEEEAASDETEEIQSEERMVYEGVPETRSNSYGDFTYDSESWGVTILSYKGTAATVTVPSAINGIAVTELADAAFKNCTGVQKVTLPSGVEKIGKECFSGCTGLKEINIPTEVKVLPDYVFQNCTSLTKVTPTDEILFSVSEVGTSAFENCRSLNITLNFNGLQKVGECAFKNCVSLPNIATIENGLDEIKKETFYGCESLKYVQIASKCQLIGESAFQGCKSLKSFSFSKYLGSIGVSAFEDCSSLAEVDIPVSVDIGEIPDFAFKNCTSLQYASLGSVKRIGTEAFYGCTSLDDVFLFSNQTEIGEKAFKNCSALPDIQISARTISDEAFMNCSSLKTISFSVGLKEIGRSAFEGCNLLQSLGFMDGLESVGDQAFRNCGGLEEIALPSSISRLGKESFAGISDLAIVYCRGTKDQFADIEDDIGQSGLPMPAWFYSVVKEGSYNRVMINSTGLNEQEVIIPEYMLGMVVSYIGEKAFEGCTEVRTVNISKYIEDIAVNAFAGSGITEINVETNNGVYSAKDGVLYDKKGKSLLAYPPEREGAYSIPDETTTVGQSAFAGCTGVTELSIPLSVTKIEKDASAGCTGLKKVIYEGKKAQWGTDIIIESGNEAILNAEFECEESEEYTVHFISFGIGNYEDLTVSEYELIPAPEVAPVREGYKFLGWYNGNDRWDFSKDRLTEDMTLTAKWEDSKEPIHKYGGKWYDAYNNMLVPTNSTFKLTVSPACAAYPDNINLIEWETTNPQIAYCDSNNSYESGIHTRNQTGTVKITATVWSSLIGPMPDMYNPGAPQEYPIRVVEPAAAVRFGTTSMTLKTGESTILEIEISPSGNWAKAAAEFAIASSDTKVVTVTSDGCIYAAGAGKATISASLSNGQIAECTVTVRDPGSVLKGDLDLDEDVNVQDLRLLLRHVCGKITFTDEQKEAADVESDDKVDVKDLRKMLRYLCGKLEEL